MNLATQYCSKGLDRESLEQSVLVSATAMRTLEWLEFNERSDGQSEIDFAMLARLMQKVCMHESILPCNPDHSRTRDSMSTREQSSRRLSMDLKQASKKQ
jgi:hypothetical protein